MKVTMYKCDNCGKITDDIYATNGWVIISGEDVVYILLTNGRREDRVADTIYHKIMKNNDVHFCSTECLIEWLKHKE